MLRSRIEFSDGGTKLDLCGPRPLPRSSQPQSRVECTLEIQLDRGLDSPIVGVHC